MKKIAIILVVLLMINSIANASLYYNISNWAKDDVNFAYENGLIPSEFEGKDFSKYASREDIALLTVNFYETKTSKKAVLPEVNPFIDTDNVAVIKAYELNIIKGVSNILFEPVSNVTREQASVIISNTLKACDIGIADKSIEKFNDDGEISSWAINSVYELKALKIILGDENNNFNPKNGITLEEVISIYKRMFLLSENKEEVVEQTEENLKNQIPPIPFEASRCKYDETENSVTLTVEGATIQEYTDYLETVKNSFPNVTNIFPNQFLMADNGKNSVNVSFGSGVIKVVITKGVN